MELVVLDQNEENSLIQSGAYTANTSSAVQINGECGGVALFLHVTANPGGGETLTLNLLWRDPISGVNYAIDAGTPFVATNGDYVWIPRVPLPRSWLVSVIHSAGGSWTYSVSASRLQHADTGRVSVLTIAAGDNNIGNVDVVTLPALPAGSNNIGDVDVLTLPALPAGNNNIGDVDVASIAAGDNNIGNVDVVTLPALPAGTNNIGDVDVLTLPALPAGTNNIGDVDIASAPTGASAIQLQGTAAVDAPAVGNPVRSGACGQSTDITPVTAADAVDNLLTLLGKQVVLPYALPARTWHYAAAAGGLVTTGGVTAKAAGTGAERNYVTKVSIVNSHQTISTEVVIRDGAAGTVLWRGWAQAAGGGQAEELNPPLRGSAATLIEIAEITTTATAGVLVNLCGYVAAE